VLVRSQRRNSLLALRLLALADWKAHLWAIVPLVGVGERGRALAPLPVIQPARRWAGQCSFRGKFGPLLGMDCDWSVKIWDAF
jgi:hypothetical protein